ncbi:MAG: HAMP domain-containing protein [Clostridiaceae bacterium]|nr:HAMP domain-containing protein [Clostridiaceae bacterium]
MPKSKIARRLSLYFVVALLVFAIVVGAVFLLLFRNYTVSVHREKLRGYAESLAESLSGQSGPGSNQFGPYLRFAGEVAEADVWIVDENMELLTISRGQGMASGRYNYTELPENAGELIDEVFEGETAFSEDFSGVLSTPTLTVGAPITDSKGDVIGAVLLHSPVEGTAAAVNRGTWMLLGSLVLALIVAFVLSVILSGSFTRPLSKMKTTALRLADGDYSAQSGVRQNDEIGELSGVLDSLAVRLDKADRESAKLETMRRDFVANVSHELKTPVTVIRGSLEALCDQVVTDPEKVDDYHLRMLDESKYLQRLVEDLLDLSRLQNADFSIEKQPVNLCDILSDAAKSASALARERNIRIRTDFQSSCLRIEGDYGRLRQMFLVILDNAVKFSPSEASVDVTASEARVIVRDYGPGIEPEHLPYIFDRFYKSRDERNKSGTGLGLSIAKQIATRHGIALTARNHPEGGAEFVFELPTSTADATPPSE